VEIRAGALPRQMIHQMIRCGAITGSVSNLAQPASLDLVLSHKMDRVSSVFYPDPDETVCEAMVRVGPEPHDMSVPLEVGVTYLSKLREELTLPDGVYGYANPKSSSGRNDVHTRVLADGISRFDSFGTRGYRGSLWVLITPRSFRPLLYPGDSLVQARFFNQDTRFRTDLDLELAYKEYQFLYTPDGQPIAYENIKITDHDGSLILTLNLNLDVVGYRCERSDKVLDWSKEDYYDPLDFFQPIPRPKNGTLVLRRGDFYILSTLEFIKVPPDFAVEMVSIDTRSGDHRAHYAGYFDPGWGFGPKGILKGAPAVMEVRSPMDDIVFRHGQPICKMTFEQMYRRPSIVYGGRKGRTGSHYLSQRGPKLSKHFKQ
jgi:dCTP deaminase